MIKEYIPFPTPLEYTIKRKTNNSIDVTFIDSVYIQHNVFNLAFMEPYKVVFTNKKKHKHIICFMLSNTTASGKKEYCFYIGNVQKENKRSLTALLKFVNKAL